MIKKEELRVGNILNYTTSENDILPTRIDWQDLKWISRDPKGFNIIFDPIPLTEEWLLKFGSKKTLVNETLIFDRFKLVYKLAYKYWYVLDLNTLTYLTKVEFVHEWQNFVYIINGKELEINQ
jgi:hypothetical protein